MLSGRWRRCSSREPLARLALLLGLALSSLAVFAAPAAARPSDRELVDVYAAVEGARLGLVLPGGPEHFIEVIDSPKHSLTVHVYGRTYQAGANTELAWSTSGSEALGARITVYRSERSDTEAQLRGAIAHEVFHVFEARMSHSEAVDDGHEGWLIEGAAAWVESDLVNNDPTARQFWREYLTSPRTPLFKRLYDAIGFFGHMQSSGISPWSKFEAMFLTRSGAAAYNDAIGASSAFLDSEASSFFREPGLGSAWDQTGQDVPSRASVGFSPAKVRITKATPPLTLSAAPYANGVYSLSISGLPEKESLVEFTSTSGDVRLRATGGGSVDALNPGRLLLCTDPAGCKCPSIHYTQFQRGDLAITGGPSGGSVKLVRLKTCESLLGAVSCQTLLPGFTAPVAAALEQSLKGLGQANSPLSAEMFRTGGSSASTCSLQSKGSPGTNAKGETVFVGVLAPFVTVVRAPNVAAAILAFKIMSSAIPGRHLEGVGDEAVLETTQGASEEGIEYGATAAVRVHNLIAYFGIVGTPGNTEASPSAAVTLLYAVAGEL